MGRLLKPLIAIGLLAGVVAVVYWLAPERSDPLSAARDALGRRDFVTARREIDTYLQRNSADRDALLLAAQATRRDGDGESAERYLERYLTVGGDPDFAAMERALRKSQEGEVGNADRVMDFCRSQPDHPNASLMLEALAQGLLKTGPPTKTIECLDLWLSNSSNQADHVQAFIWRGRALQQMGLAPDAAEDYKRALELDDLRTDARLPLAQFQTRHEPQTALAHFQRLEKEIPNNKEVQLGMAQCHRQLGDPDKANTILAPLLTEYPDDVTILTEAATLALDRGLPKIAEQHLRRALRIRPKSRDANVQLARCLHELGRESEAKEQLERIKEIDDELYGRFKEHER